MDELVVENDGTREYKAENANCLIDENGHGE
jgi:hypothetical protein